jgi:predicted nucleic acid-binding protein
LILVDTSVWVDHLRSTDAQLAELLERQQVAMHPFVIGEIACGSLKKRASVFELLTELPTAVLAEADEVLGFIERHALYGKSIGYVDAHLIASAALTEDAKLWTRDKRLLAVAQKLGCAFQDSSVH